MGRRLLGLAAALIGGISTFFNFGKLFEGHRSIANKYINLAAKCEISIARYRDNLIDLEGLDKLLQELQESYSEISEESKAFPTSERDFKVALDSETIRVKTMRDRQKVSHGPHFSNRQTQSIRKFQSSLPASGAPGKWRATQAAQEISPQADPISCKPHSPGEKLATKKSHDFNDQFPKATNKHSSLACCCVSLERSALRSDFTFKAQDRGHDSGSFNSLF